MTETEAKTKWCPMVRLPAKIDDPEPGVNRFGSCIGSACMMWRLEKTLPFETRDTPSSLYEGYCGLAGKL